MSIPASTITIIKDTVKRAYGFFCWTPTVNDVRSNPYYFSVTVKDDHCPVYGTSMLAYSITVHNGFSIKTSIEKITCADYNFKASPNDNSAFNKKWIIYKGNVAIDSIVNKDSIYGYKFTSVGTYYIHYTATNSCNTVTTSDTLIITNSTPLNIVSSSIQAVCKGDSVTLATVPLNGTSPYTYEWYLDNLPVSNLQTFKTLPLKTANYLVKVTSSDSCKMNKTDTVKVIVETQGLVLQPISDLIHCRGTYELVTPGIIHGTPPYLYEWFSKGTLISTSASLQITAITATDYILKMHSFDLCYNQASDTFHVDVDTSGLVVRDITDTAICNTDTIIITPVIFKGKGPLYYRWYSGGNLISLNPILKVKQVVKTQYILAINSFDYCHSLFTDTFIVYTDNNLQLQIKKLRDTVVCPNVILNLIPPVLNGLPPFQYKWYNAGGVVSTVSNFNIIPTLPSKYFLEVSSANQCINRLTDSFNVSALPSNPLQITTKNSQISTGQNTVLNSNGKRFFIWTGPDILTNWSDSILVKPSVTSTYKLESQNPNGCNDSAKLLITVSNVGIHSIVSDHVNFFELYPNPAFDELIIRFNQHKLFHKTFTILNILGQEMKSGQLQPDETKVNISSFPCGIYFVRIGEEVERFVKK